MKRPAGVIVIAIFLIISSAMGIFAGLRGLGIDIPGIGPMVLSPDTLLFLIIPIASATFLVLSAIGFVVAIGLIMLKGWARSAGVAISAILFFLFLFFFSSGGFFLGAVSQSAFSIGLVVGLGGALLSLISWIYLTRGGVKEAFAT